MNTILFGNGLNLLNGTTSWDKLVHGINDSTDDAKIPILGGGQGCRRVDSRSERGVVPAILTIPISSCGSRSNVYASYYSSEARAWGRDQIK